MQLPFVTKNLLNLFLWGSIIIPTSAIPSPIEERTLVHPARPALQHLFTVDIILGNPLKPIMIPGGLRVGTILRSSKF